MPRSRLAPVSTRWWHPQDRKNLPSRRNLARLVVLLAKNRLAGTHRDGGFFRIAAGDGIPVVHGIHHGTSRRHDDVAAGHRLLGVRLDQFVRRACHGGAGRCWRRPAPASIWGGVFADRLPKRRILQVGLAAAKFFSVLLALDVLAFWHLIAATGAEGEIFVLMMSSRQSMSLDVARCRRHAAAAERRRFEHEWCEKSGW